MSMFCRHLLWLIHQGIQRYKYRFVLNYGIIINQINGKSFVWGHGTIWIHILLSFTKYMLKILNMLNNLWVSRIHFLLLLPFIFVKTPKTKKVLNKRRSVFRLQYFRNSCCFLYIYLPRMNVSICGRKRYSGKPANIWYTTNLLMLGIKMWRRDLYGKQRKNTLRLVKPSFIS